MMKMLSYLKPDAVFENMRVVPYSELKEKGYQYALLDLDNTLAEDHVTEPTPYTFEIIRSLQDNGFTCCIVSNAKSTRSAEFAAKIPIDCLSYANKPSPSGIIKALSLLNAPKNKAVFFGDQILTDVIAARRAGIYTVLVEPITKREVFYVRLKRPLEKIIRFFMQY